MNLPVILAWGGLLLGIPLNLYVTFRLVSLSRANPKLRVLRERAITSIAVTALVVAFTLVFFNNDAAVPPLDAGFTKILTRLVISIATGGPALYWLWLYRKLR